MKQTKTDLLKVKPLWIQEMWFAWHANGIMAAAWAADCRNASFYSPTIVQRASEQHFEMPEWNKSIRKKEQPAILPRQLTAAYTVVRPKWQISNMTAAHSDIYVEMIQPWATWMCTSPCMYLKCILSSGCLPDTAAYFNRINFESLVLTKVMLIWAVRWFIQLLNLYFSINRAAPPHTGC